MTSDPVYSGASFETECWVLRTKAGGYRRGKPGHGERYWAVWRPLLVGPWNKMLDAVAVAPDDPSELERQFVRHFLAESSVFGESVPVPDRDGLLPKASWKAFYASRPCWALAGLVGQALRTVVLTAGEKERLQKDFAAAFRARPGSRGIVDPVIGFHEAVQALAWKETLGTPPFATIDGIWEKKRRVFEVVMNLYAEERARQMKQAQPPQFPF